jgi:hypothetical protein
MNRIHVVQDFPQPIEDLFAFLSEHENLGPLFRAKVRRLGDGSDGTRNGVGSSRELRVGPIRFVETNTEVVPNELIRYRITKGGFLKDHHGAMRFTPNATGSHLDYTITFKGRPPGIGPPVTMLLTRSITRALRQFAQSGARPADDPIRRIGTDDGTGKSDT